MKKQTFIFALLLGIFLSHLSWATETPIATIRKVHNLLLQYDDKSPQAERLKTEINQYFALDLIAQKALLDHWNTMNVNQRKEYKRLMFELLEKAVYTDTHDNLQKGKVRYKGQRLTGTRATVLTNIYIPEDDMEVDNDFLMSLTGKIWVVQDIFIDGASLTEDYRSQFNKIVLDHGLEGDDQSLFARLRKAVQEDQDEWRKNKKSKTQEQNLTEQKRTTQRRPLLLEK